MARKKRKKDQETEELLAPDAFEAAGASGVQWFEKNGKYLLMGAGMIVIGVIIGEFVSSGQERSSSEMTSELNGILEQYSEVTDLNRVLTSTVPEKVQRGYTESQQALAEFRTKFSGEPAAVLAGLYEADLQRRLGEPSKAIPLYEKYLAQFGEDANFAFLAHEGAGYAHEKLGNLDKAVAHFEKMGSAPFAKGYSLKHQARLMEAKGDRERALALYRELTELEGPLKTFAEERVRMLE